MGKPFDYKKWANALDVRDSSKCIGEIKKLMSDSALDDRQKMVALGFLIDRNKENYINDLKATIGSRNKEIELLKQKNNVTKKKIIIKKK